MDLGSAPLWPRPDGSYAGALAVVTDIIKHKLTEAASLTRRVITGSQAFASGTFVVSESDLDLVQGGHRRLTVHASGVSAFTLKRCSRTS
jgi:hypothetical protein